jgi:hypothetical protein
VHKSGNSFLGKGKGKFAPIHVVKVWGSGDTAREMRK